MMKKFNVLFYLILLVAGCSVEMNLFVAAYSNAPAADIEIKGSSYRIYERADLSRVYVRGSFVTSWNQGWAIGKSTHDDVRLSQRSAALKYLVNHGGRGCVVDDGKEVRAIARSNLHLPLDRPGPVLNENGPFS